MEQVTFNGMLIAGLVILLGLVTAIITPIIKLNTNIVTLNNTIQSLIKNDDEQDKTIKEHGELLHKHDKRIFALESKNPSK